MMLENFHYGVFKILYAVSFEYFELPFLSCFLFRYVDDIYRDNHRKMGKTLRYTYDQSRLLS